MSDKTRVHRKEQTPQETGYIPKRQATKSRTLRKRTIVELAALALILLVAVVVILCKGCSGGGELDVLQGAWRYDSYTEYEFDGEGNGCMCIDETDHYEFRYAVKGSTVKIDFALDYVTDCAYDFKVEKDRLTLIGGEGTANPGQEYTLERVR